MEIGAGETGHCQLKKEEEEKEEKRRKTRKEVFDRKIEEERLGVDTHSFLIIYSGSLEISGFWRCRGVRSVF